MDNNFVNTWKDVVKHPNDFFRSMPVSGGYHDPLIFAFINYIIVAILGTAGGIMQTMALVESEVIPAFIYSISNVMALLNRNSSFFNPYKFS